MSVKKSIIEVGFDKNGQFDFSVSCSIARLSLPEMNDLRAMIVVAIGTAEEMFRQAIFERETTKCNSVVINKP